MLDQSLAQKVIEIRDLLKPRSDMEKAFADWSNTAHRLDRALEARVQLAAALQEQQNLIAAAVRDEQRLWYELIAVFAKANNGRSDLEGRNDPAPSPPPK